MRILVPFLEVLQVALQLYWWVVIVWIVMTWLVQFNVINLFNQRHQINAFSTFQQFDGITFNEAAFYRGQLNFDQLITAQAITKDPRFLMQNGFQTPLQARFGVKFLF